MTAIQLASEVADAIRASARAANRAGNTAAAEAYWAAAELVTDTFNREVTP
jgi:hypothetical protein